MAGSCGAFCSFCGRCGRQIAKELRSVKPADVAPPGVADKDVFQKATLGDTSESGSTISNHLTPVEGGLHE